MMMNRLMSSSETLSVDSFCAIAGFSWKPSCVEISDVFLGIVIHVDQLRKLDEQIFALNQCEVCRQQLSVEWGLDIPQSIGIAIQVPGDANPCVSQVLVELTIEVPLLEPATKMQQ